jgi:hypothetical protein
VSCGGELEAEIRSGYKEGRPLKRRIDSGNRVSLAGITTPLVFLVWLSYHPRTYRFHVSKARHVEPCCGRQVESLARDPKFEPGQRMWGPLYVPLSGPHGFPYWQYLDELPTFFPFVWHQSRQRMVHLTE